QKKMSNNNSTKSSLAFFLSILIHGLLAVAIIYTGLDMTLPEGTVGSTEVEFVSGPLPLGSQISDVTQIEDRVAETKPAPPPPPPPTPKVEAPKPAPPIEALPPATTTTDVVDTESESEVI